MPKRESKAADIARVDFEPWDASLPREFDRAPWQERCRVLGINLRIGSVMMTKTKSELVEIVRQLIDGGSPDSVTGVDECLKSAAEELRALADLAQAAYMRHLVAMSVVATAAAD